MWLGWGEFLHNCLEKTHDWSPWRSTVVHPSFSIEPWIKENERCWFVIKQTHQIVSYAKKMTQVVVKQIIQLKITVVLFSCGESLSNCSAADWRKQPRLCSCSLHHKERYSIWVFAIKIAAWLRLNMALSLTRKWLCVRHWVCCHWVLSLSQTNTQDLSLVTTYEWFLSHHADTDPQHAGHNHLNHLPMIYKMAYGYGYMRLLPKVQLKVSG